MSELEEQTPSVEQLLSIVVVQNQRIYDTLIAILTEQNEEVARRLLDVHEKMDNIGPAPFLVDEATDFEK
jgi:hypothetical protein